MNQDIPEGLHNDRIDIYSPLDRIPCPARHFDTIFCNAVLEHVADPDKVLEEFYRVLSNDGHLYLGVPFLQPYHADPTDFRRLTKDGLCQIVERHGFRVIEAESVHSVYHTLAWIVDNWLMSEHSFHYVALRCILFPILRHRCVHSRKKVDNIASGFRLIAIKEIAASGPNKRVDTYD